MQKKAAFIQNNIMLNEYETQSQLNTELWDGDQLHSKLRVGFIKIAKAFYKFLGIDTSIVDVLLIGSNANYNWTEHSDIDLHVLINYLDVNDNYHVVKELMHAKKSIWNQNYPLTYKGMHIELYAQDAQQELHSTVGVYSVMQGKWLKKPSSKTVSVDDSAIKQKAQPYAYEIDQLDPSNDKIEQRIQNLKQRLKHLRQIGLESEGEYSVENMAYKYLRNKGYLERLKELEKSITMNSLQLENAGNELDEVAKCFVRHISGETLMRGDDWVNIIKKTQARVDPRGQWQHPGHCTVIPTNNGAITMKRVAYDVLGIDETGHYIMMKPEQEYQYPGKVIFEIPNTAQWQTVIIQILNEIRNGSKYTK